MNEFIYYILFCFLLVLFVIYWNSTNKQKVTQKNDIKLSKPLKHVYKGLVLFDLDGTLAVEDNENEAIVQACLDNNFAVGISTAGSIYTMNNLLSYGWMPRNLYNFIKDHDNLSFNNVGSYILAGKYSPEKYQQFYIKPNSQNEFLTHFGYLKGYTMQETAIYFGITDPRRIILSDDQTTFLQGAYDYNPNFTLLCSGENCGQKLTVKSIKEAMNYALS